MFLSSVLLSSIATLAAASCECGYEITSPGYDQPLLFTDAIESDFTKIDKLGPGDSWVPQEFNVTAKDGRGRYGKSFSPENVVIRPRDERTAAEDDGSLELKVAGGVRNGAVSGAEVDSRRLDLHWGSFRAGMKVTDVNGTCAAFFWYFNDTQEIDMEFLSREFDRSKNLFPVNLVVQTDESLKAGYDASKTGHFQTVNLGFDPTADFHEYRFDYSLGKVAFFANGKLLAEMAGTGMPTSGGHLILQHWSNGNPLWSGGPPEEDAVLSVKYVRAYFNSSEPSAETRLDNECGDAERVCRVADVTDGEVGGGSEEEDNGGARAVVMLSPVGWTATLAAMVGLLD